jgi:hypothetical protein
VRPVISDNLNGTYTYTYVPPKSGHYTLMVRINSLPVLARATDVFTGAGTITQVVTYAAVLVDAVHSRTMKGERLLHVA